MCELYFTDSTCGYATAIFFVLEETEFLSLSIKCNQRYDEIFYRGLYLDLTPLLSSVECCEPRKKKEKGKKTFPSGLPSPQLLLFSVWELQWSSTGQRGGRKQGGIVGEKDGFS